MNIRNFGWALVPAVALSLMAWPTWASAADGSQPAERRQQGTLIIERIPQIPQNIIEKMNQYLSVRSAAFGGWDPSGQGMLIFTRFGQTNQVHRVASPLAYREQLTFFNDKVSGICVNPVIGQNNMILQKDIGGTENYQLFFYNLDNGDMRMISNGKDRYGTVVWNKAGKQIAYQSTERNGADWDIWIADPLHPEKARMVYAPGGHWSVESWSNDGRYLLLNNYISITDSRLYVLDIASGQVKRLGTNKADERFAVGTGTFSADSRKVFFTSDKGSQFPRLCCQDIASGTVSVLAPQLKWGVEEIAVDENGRNLAFIANEDGLSALYLMDLYKGSYRYQKVAGLPEGQLGHLDFNQNGTQLAMTVSAAASPGDAYVLNLANLQLQRWTKSEVGGLNTDKFVAPQLFHYPTFDKVANNAREIPAFCFMPRNAQEGPVPVLIYIHGGPESQYTPYFSSFIQYLVCEMGIAVIAPNVRGSYGYGKEYVTLDNGFKREDSVKDIGALIDWIGQDARFNSKKIAVMGGSYGGYMTLASMVHYSDKLACGVDNVGISNFVTFLTNTHNNRRDLRRAEYGDERDPKMKAFMQRTAPANNAHKITKPMFIAQGKNDPRVPVTEAEQMVAKIRAAGGDVWYLCAEDEGHGFAKKGNRDFYNQATVMFLQKHLCDK